MSQRANANGRTQQGAAVKIGFPLPSPLSLLFFVTAIALLIFAVSDIRQSARFADVFLVAERLEQSGQVSPETLTKTTAMTDMIVSGDYCRSDIVMAGTTLVLNRLDTADEITGYDAWLRASDGAERFMRHAVSCMPTESNLWLRLAMVRSVIVQEPKAIARFVDMSARLAPADEVALLARVYFWNRLHAATLEAARKSLQGDVNLLLALGDPHEVGRSLAVISPALLPFVKEAGAKLPPDRKALLLAFGVKAFGVLRR